LDTPTARRPGLGARAGFGARRPGPAAGVRGGRPGRRPGGQRRGGIGPALPEPRPELRDQLGGRRDDPARQEQDHQQEQHPEQDLAQVLVGVLQREPLLAGLDDQGAQDRAGDGAEPAQERHHHHQQVEERVEGELGQGLADEVEPQPAGHPGHHRRDHERGQLHRHGADAEPGGPVLVVPDGPQLQAEA
jgi:hypothetical protein